MVMTRRPPTSRNNLRPSHKTVVNGNDEEDQLHDHWKSTTSTEELRSNALSLPVASARSLATPPPVASAAAALQSTQASVASHNNNHDRNSNSGLSLYQELLQYHREHPDEEEAAVKEERNRNDTVKNDEDDRKPAARSLPHQNHQRNNQNSQNSNSNSNKPRNGIYRMPVSREYFAAKQDLDASSSHHSNSNGNNHSSSGSLAEWDRDSRIISAVGPHSDYGLPTPFADSFQDLAEDEALARQLQAEEEERLAEQERKKKIVQNRVAPPATAHLPLEPQIIDKDEALARQLAALRTDPQSQTIPTPLSAAPSTFNRNDHAWKYHPTPTNMVIQDDDIARQAAILRDISEANEREQLAWALEESQKQAGITSPSMIGSVNRAGRPNGHAPDWETTQRTALAEFERKQQQLHRRSSSGDYDGHQIFSERQRRYPSTGKLSLRSEESVPPVSHQSPREAGSGIRLHIVRCHGCKGRLRAPVQYSLVYCPRCGHVSPGDPA